MSVNYHQDEVVRFLQWMADYPEKWQKIWNQENSLSAHECIEMIEELEKNSLYTIIPILMMKNKYSREVGKAVEQFFVSNTIRMYEKEGIGALCQALKKHLKKEFETSGESFSNDL